MVIEPREMTAEDVSAVATTGARMHRTCSFSNLRYDMEHITYFLNSLVTHDEGNAFVVYDGRDLAGFILCSVSPCFFGPDLVASEFCLYVHPDYRETGMAKQLTQAYVDWATAKGAKRINVGNSAGTPDEAYAGLMESQGFTKTGSLLHKNV